MTEDGGGQHNVVRPRPGPGLTDRPVANTGQKLKATSREGGSS